MTTQGTTGIKARRKPGRNGLYYGMTEKKSAQLSAFAKNTKNQASSSVRAMAEFTSIFLKHARDLAKSGYKDEARNWWRFFNNSQILDVLKSFPEIESQAELQAQLRDLQNECHPLQEANWQTDIEAIRFALDEILQRLPASPVASSRRGRPDLGPPCRGSVGQKTFERVKTAVESPLLTVSRSPARLRHPGGVFVFRLPCLNASLSSKL